MWKLFDGKLCRGVFYSKTAAKVYAMEHGIKNPVYVEVKKGSSCK